MQQLLFLALSLYSFFCFGILQANDLLVREKPVFVVMNFDEGIQNKLGGYYSKFEFRPSSASTLLTDKIFRGKGGHSLRIRANRQEEGFAGQWMHFFNFREETITYFDASSYDYLSFWVKGEKGGENFTVKLADAGWIEIEDSASVASIDQLLPDGVTQEWQEVLIPLSEAPINTAELGGLTLDFTEPGTEYTVYIDDIAFKREKTALTPETQQASTMLSGSPYSFKDGLSLQRSKAMWLWLTHDILFNSDRAEELIAFCQEQGIEHIWMQVLYGFSPPLNIAQPPRDEYLPSYFKAFLRHPDEVRAFLRRAHNAGLKVHALDGYPEYAQKEYHYAPLAIVDAIIEFNKYSPPEERYYGIHFDNEPYLLIGWRDAQRRERILEEFLELNAECQRRVSEQSDMVYGIDIPFWWGYKDPVTGEPAGIVTFRGERKSAELFCIDLLDNVGIMNYRDTADGADGMIAHGREVLKYANQKEKAEIFMGVETFSYQPTQVWFPLGLPKEAFFNALEGQALDFSFLSRIDGFRTQILDDGINMHVGIELPPDPSPEIQEQIERTMIKIWQRFGASAYPELNLDIPGILLDAEFGVDKDIEWEGSFAQPIRDPDTGQLYEGFVATSIMLPKTTFADEDYTEIQEQLELADKSFSKHPSYTGLAIHYYDTFRKKVEGSE